MTTRTIVVGVDGSEPARAAIRWCVEHAPALDARVVAVHAVEVPVYAGGPFELAPLPGPDPAWQDELRVQVEQEWCASLQEAGIPWRVVLDEGSPAAVIARVATETSADLVVVCRRGRGGFTELVLGSVSHQLAHHAPCPVVIVPPPG